MRFDSVSGIVQTIVLPGDTIVNTAVQTNFATNLMLLANSVIPGDIIKITAGGPYGTVAVGVHSLDVNVSIGGSQVLSSGVRIPMINAVNRPWTFQGDLACTLDGPGGFINGTGVWTFYNNLGTSDDVWTAFSFGLPFDSSIDNLIELGCAWGAASPNNSLGMTSLVIYLGR